MRELLESAGRRGYHSLAAGVTADGTTVSEGWSATGPVPDPKTLFEIGSITKAFTGVLLADMHLRGEVALDDPLSRHLDGPALRGTSASRLCSSSPRTAAASRTRRAD